ncbi:uncharacterized protein LOC143034544 [Oratosquilla oratoria]|uniref:uncharacterized protein LOC143034544 n=1 Tax=Oratosquilla oratoria TaxID=337810 RepID=UPI003F758A8B
MDHCFSWILLTTYTLYSGLSVGSILWTYYGISSLISSDISDDTNYQFSAGPEGIISFLLVLVSCGASAVVAALITLVGIYSRSIFNTTLAIHGSLSLGILHIVMIVVFLLRRSEPFDFPGFLWSAVINGSFLGLCTLQVILGIMHLKRQKNIWIALNLKEFFSLNSLFFIARTVLTGYLIDAFISHVLWPSIYFHSYHQYPSWRFYFSVVAIGTCTVVNGQCLLSACFGSLYRAFAIVSSILLIVVCGCLTGVNSPHYLSRIYNKTINSHGVYTFSLYLSLVHHLHLILLVKPNGSIRSFLGVMKKNLEDIRLSLNVEGLTQQLQSSHSESLNIKKKIYYNLISLSVSIVSLIFIATASWLYPKWPKVVLVSVCTSQIIRSLSAVLYEAVTHKVYSTALQVLLVSIIEFILVLVGAVDIFGGDAVLPILGAVTLLCVYIVQFWMQRDFIICILKSISSKVNEETLHEETEKLTDSTVTTKEQA